ncbi:metallopeptidase TldD-related protein [Rhodococcus sp. ARC_M6]|uniref:metallopeptidase TldD-related protein n=1 Tax=Rhodococcus sp. ARC_M6 TaxID=2928852 RepID=UPI001FB1B4BE|nr:metallopeptidase TldD-related protein [Rhodococcus sp. ARC_M6]MCJ0905950.1 metallopeptidase TldD-related protein [Rhodococcus sp. ARC_M6]
MIMAQQVVERALAARTVDESIVIVTDASEASLRWANNSMTTNGVSLSRTWTVISIVRDGDVTRVGTVSSSSVDPEQIITLVKASEEAARTATPADDASDLIPAGPASSDWDLAPVLTDINVFAQLASDLATGFDGDDQLFGFAHHQLHTTWLGTSSGVRRRTVQPTGSVEINGKRGDASAWVGSGTVDFTDISTSDLLSQLTTRLDWAKNSVSLPAGRYETILPPSAVADLMIYLMWTMEGRGAEEGHTALSTTGGTRIGETLGNLALTLTSDPEADGLESAPFVVTTSSSESVSVFDNGLDIDRVDWIKDGMIAALAYPRHAAREFGRPVAVPGDNLLLTGGDSSSIEDMIANTEKGLLLTTLWYVREVDPTTLLLTGLTRDGVYLIENGKIVGAVNNFRFNESPLDLLRRVTEAGRTEVTLPREWKDWFTRTAMPPLRIPDFHMSSVSAAQ